MRQEFFIDSRGIFRRDLDVLLLIYLQAARDGRIDIVKGHIERLGRDKKKLNKKDHENTTALHYAVRYNHMSIVKLLVESGASK